MGSHMNFKNFSDAPPVEGTNGKLQGNYTLARQSSVYSLTFDEFQNTLGGFGKDFGSMNMDELLKNIWTAEEIQAMTSIGGGEGSVPGGNLQRQGSLTLPRTLSQKTVDEVWRDLTKESSGGGGGGAKVESCNGGSNVPQRQQTLGEITLEEFLVRAGVVREDTQPTGKPDNDGFFGELLRPNNIGELSRPNNNNSLTFGFHQPIRSNGVLHNRMMENNNSVPNQPPSLAMNVGGLRSSQQQIQQLQQQQPLFPKPATVAFASPVHLVNNAQLANPGNRGSVVGVVEPSMNTALVQGGGIGMVGLGPGVVTNVAGSPASQISSEAKSTIDTSSLSPIPYVFSRGRKSGGALEKVVERRQRRMIKNRESAARSRARKQAYTLELEAEVAKLKEMNQELEKKQAEIMEMQKDQKLETMNRQWGSKRQCLRRTVTGPW
ncbi:ABSCISIC ACID-INSENSITIVE 5-like protein 7 [Fagus crenata]